MKKSKIKILHTSDWHIGRALYGRKRYAEYEAFLNWLAERIVSEEVDALLVAGDVFDNSSPSNRAQELYYRFLCRVAGSRCRHVIVVAGNHDSPSFLNAPKEILRFLDVHVVGAASISPEDDVIVLQDAEGVPELIVCAVPYLRDRDIRTAEAGESIEDKDRKLVEGVRDRYARACALAEEKRSNSNLEIPIISMGHLFAAGGKTVEGDGVRELYVGSLAHVSSAIFPECIDYLALGHLHVPQKVGGAETMRYSGSPLPMGFGEAKQEKSLCLVEFSGRESTVSILSVPRFQELERISGDWEKIFGRLDELIAAGSGAWIEIVYEGNGSAGDLNQRLEEKIAGTNLEIRRIKNNRAATLALTGDGKNETLDDLNANDVFDRLLKAHEISDGLRTDLLRAYGEIVADLHEEDSNAE